LKPCCNLVEPRLPAPPQLLNQPPGRLNQGLPAARWGIEDQVEDVPELVAAAVAAR
jgi:hypothetical protein